MMVKHKDVPEDIRKTYNLADKVTQDGYVYGKISKGIYGLKQAALLAYNNQKNLLPYGYTPV